MPKRSSRARARSRTWPSLPLGEGKKRIGARLDSRATIGEGVQNMLCAYLAAAVLAGLLANTWFGLWWADPVIALGIAALAVHEGREAWEGEKTTTIEPAPQCGRSRGGTPSAAELELRYRLGCVLTNLNS